MPINWNKFKTNMVNFFESQSAETESDVAVKLANEYENAMKTGADVIWGNTILTGNKKAFEAVFQKAFEGMKKGMPPATAMILMGNASVAYWVGATLKIGAPPTIIPPTGATTITANTVIAPGLPVPVKLTNTSETDEFVNNLISSFKKHLLTIGGTTVAVVATPAGPVPTPFPFIGYK